MDVSERERESVCDARNFHLLRSSHLFVGLNWLLVSFLSHVNKNIIHYYYYYRRVYQESDGRTSGTKNLYTVVVPMSSHVSISSTSQL